MIETLAVISAMALLAVWVAYPLGIAAVAALRKRVTTGRTQSESPSVSVIVATHAESASIRARMNDILAGSYDPERLEVVVAWDARNGQDLGELGLLDERVCLVRGDEPGGKAATLNAAVRAANGEILVFADTYQRFAPDAIPRLVAAITHPRIGAVSGSLELEGRGDTYSLVDLYWKYERWLRRCEARIHSSVGVTGAIYAIRRSLWTPLPPGLLLDDVYVPLKIVLRGYRVVFARDARAFETRQSTWTNEYRRKVRTLTGNIQLCLWLPSVLIPFHNPIWVQFLFHKLFRLLTPYWLIACGVWVAAVCIGWVGNNPHYAFVPLALLLLLGLLAMGGVGKALRSLVVQGALMQAAVIAATINGLRGRWDVWVK